MGGIPTNHPGWGHGSTLDAGGMDEVRTVRSRATDAAEFADRRQPARNRGTTRKVVQIFNGGSIPKAADKVFLGYPIEIDADDVEGAIPSFKADMDQPLPIVLVNGPAAAGDYLVAHAIAGRWVAEKIGSTPNPCGCYVGCGGCQLPKADMTVSWNNVILGAGSATLSWNGSGSWVSECTNQLIFELTCAQNSVEFVVFYFVSGSCPGGQSQFCANIRSNPFRLIQTSMTCDGGSFSMTCRVTTDSCPNLASNGYTDFTITGTSTPPPPTSNCVRVCASCPSMGPISGATVTVTGPRGGGTGTTGPGGCVVVVVDSPPPYTVTISNPGFPTLTYPTPVSCAATFGCYCPPDSPDCCVSKTNGHGTCTWTWPGGGGSGSFALVDSQSSGCCVPAPNVDGWCSRINCLNGQPTVQLFDCIIGSIVADSRTPPPGMTLSGTWSSFVLTWVNPTGAGDVLTMNFSMEPP